MIRDDVCYLVAEDPTPRGIFEPHEDAPRMVYCRVRSIGQTEYYRAFANGLHPSIAFVLQDAAEYRGEKVVLWQPRYAETQRRYRVIRTYQDGHALEIYCEEATVDA